EPQEQREQRRLPSTRTADESDGLSRTQLEIDPANDIDVACRIPKRHALEPDRCERGTRCRSGSGCQRRVRQIEEELRDGRAVGARMPLCGEVPERKVELGREHE